jgi:hypothetical protein
MSTLRKDEKKMGEKSKWRRFETYGPFEIPLDTRQITRAAGAKFWKEVVESNKSDLPRAIGCYIFAIKTDEAVTPWYVGKTEKASFLKEALHDAKVRLYQEVIGKHPSGKPLLFLIARQLASGKMKKSTSRFGGSITELENMLIGTCYERNPELLNFKGTKYRKVIIVPGYMNDDGVPPSPAAHQLRKLLGIKRRSSISRNRNK